MRRSLRVAEHWNTEDDLGLLPQPGVVSMPDAVPA
jgi:hypothetical protein